MELATNFKKYFLILLGVTALTYGSIGYADTVNTISGTLADGSITTFSNDATVNGEFTDTWEFTLGPAHSDVQVILNNVAVGGGLVFNIAGLTGTLDGIGGLVFTAANLAAGPHTLTVSGTGTGALGGLYSGSLSVTAVPLPAAAWLFGSAVLGLSLVSRRKQQAKAAV